MKLLKENWHLLTTNSSWIFDMTRRKPFLDIAVSFHVSMEWVWSWGLLMRIFFWFLVFWLFVEKPIFVMAKSDWTLTNGNGKTNVFLWLKCCGFHWVKVFSYLLRVHSFRLVWRRLPLNLISLCCRRFVDGCSRLKKLIKILIF